MRRRTLKIWRCPSLVWLSLVFTLGFAQALGAEPILVKPNAVVLQIDESVKDQTFVPFLKKRLTQALVPEVTVAKVALALAPLRPGLGAIDGTALLNSVIPLSDWQQQQKNTIQVYLIADDMRLPPANFNFAVSAGTPATPFHAIIVSLDRLQDIGLLDKKDSAPAATASRIVKLIVKNVAKVSGYASSQLCVFGFPRNLQELDAMPEGYCEPDLSVLIAAGIAKRL